MINQYLDQRNGALIRLAMEEHAYQSAQISSEIVDDAIAYFERETDNESVRGKMKERFAVGLERVRGGSDDAVSVADDDYGYEIYVRGGTAAAIDQGIYESVTSGLGGKIASAHATLFTNDRQVWSYFNDIEKDDKNEDVEKLIGSHREAGGFYGALSGADYIACSVNGSFVYVYWQSGHLVYSAIPPSCLHAIYHSEIEEDGKLRGVDYTSIEDATAWIIRLATNTGNSSGKSKFLAIFGRSSQYELGRHVEYEAYDYRAIPKPGDGGIDYMDGGQVANPLSVLAAKNTDELIPEYPIVAIDGGFSRTKQWPVQVNHSLYNNCLEVDVAYSRLLKDSLNSARGKDIIKNPTGARLPPSLEGPVALSKDQEAEVIGRDASNSVGAMQVLESEVVSMANGYNVPDYMVVQDPARLTASSGVALYVRTQPLVQFRNHRISINKTSVSRLWDVEKSYIRHYTGDESVSNVIQVWDPGTYAVPENPADKSARLKADQDAGYIDYVRAVRERHNLATDEEAMALIDQFNERKGEYPPPGAKPPRAAPRVGLSAVNQQG